MHPDGSEEALDTFRPVPCLNSHGSKASWTELMPGDVSACAELRLHCSRYSAGAIVAQ
jgi:hypothetical protein